MLGVKVPWNTGWRQRWFGDVVGGSARQGRGKGGEEGPDRCIGIGVAFDLFPILVSWSLENIKV